MRSTWDALARADPGIYVGDPARALAELESLFGRLGADPRGGTCVEVGCGPGRMTGYLAERFDRVLALDVSPAMVAQARARSYAEGWDNVAFEVVCGERLDGVAGGMADVVVCYLVLQHLPARRLVEAYLSEIGRVLAPAGTAFIQLPVLEPGLVARAWRLLRSAAVPIHALLARGPEASPALRGVRLSGSELGRAIGSAGLVVGARDTGPDAPYRFSRDVFLRLERA